MGTVMAFLCSRHKIAVRQAIDLGRQRNRLATHAKGANMSLANGRHYLAIPGPSVMPDQVLQAMHRAAPNIYSGDLVTMTESIVRDLKVVAGTEHDVAIYIANGHGVWEAALRNIVKAGDRVLVPTVGMFGRGWATMATSLGIDVELMEFAPLEPMDMSRVAARLAADKDPRSCVEIRL